MAWRLTYCWLLVALLVGCSSIAPPQLWHPGSAQVQRQRAEKFDPYPLPDLGPETTARPLGFILPAPENERVQNADSFAERFHQAPPPGLYRGQRTLPRPGVPFLPEPVPGAPTVFVP